MAEPRSDQGGLEYLVKAGKLPNIGDDRSQEQSASSSSAPADDRNLQAFAAPTVLTAVRDIESGRPAGTGAQLSEVAEQIGMGADVLIPLARRLTEAGMLQVIESTAFGDQTVTVTPEGIRLLDEGATRELIERVAAS
ncbi:MAG TPA: hypothetical protein VID47_02280 [Actinomycetota bacterium]